MMHSERSRKREIIKHWQIANVTEMGMDAVLEEGKKMFKMTLDEMKAYIKDKKDNGEKV